MYVKVSAIILWYSDIIIPSPSSSFTMFCIVTYDNLVFICMSDNDLLLGAIVYLIGVLLGGGEIVKVEPLILEETGEILLLDNRVFSLPEMDLGYTNERFLEC